MIGTEAALSPPAEIPGVAGAIPVTDERAA